ncbi:MAG: DUF5946 family protein [Clostridiales bacterium]|jgi:hypothetical protein|nr:DUF5946 family protein [Clostridiales bacterium]
MKNCPQCGADNDKIICEQVFHTILSMEPDSPKLQSEHFKTVACYIIQHPAIYTDEAIKALVSALRDNLNHNVSVSEILKRHSRIFEGTKRVRKNEGAAFVQKKWSMTIRDCCVTNDCESTSDNIVKWAKSIVNDWGAV